MKERNPIAVFLLPFVTFGIYSLYWAVKTKGEMNRLGENIPTAWIWLIPFIGIFWWFWKYSEGVEHVTKNKIGAILAFILLILLDNIGQAIVQDYFNKVEESTSFAPAAPVASVAPESSYAPGAPAQFTPPESPTPIEPQATEKPEETPPSAPTAPTFPQ